MTGNWAIIALALAPLVFVASLCLLPDALNLQHQLGHRFEPGTHAVGWYLAQAPYAPPTVRAVQPLFPVWEIRILEILVAILSFSANLLVLCTLARIQAGLREATLVGEVIEIYRRAICLLPSFFLVAALQLLATAVGVVLLIVPGFLAFVWLYFAQYALVFDNQRGWSALLRSRDLMRGRFFSVAMRIVVFLAVWSGFNAWSSGIFVAMSFVLGLLAITEGFLSVAVILVFDFIWISVGFATTAFFYAAGVRLYQDLKALSREQTEAATEMVLPPTAPLSGTMRG